MKTPGQKNPSYENGVIRKLNYVGGNRYPPRAEQDFSQEEEDTPRKQQRFQRAFAPDLHAEETPFPECSDGVRQLSLAQRFRGEWRTRYRERYRYGRRRSCESVNMILALFETFYVVSSISGVASSKVRV